MSVRGASGGRPGLPAVHDTLPREPTDVAKSAPKRGAELPAARTRSTATTDVRACHDVRAELLELTAERDAPRAQLAGHPPVATRWLPHGIAPAVDLGLNRRVASQRLVLRTLDEVSYRICTVFWSIRMRV